MVNAQKIANSKTWIIRYRIPVMNATNVMGIPADSEEKAIDYFKRIYCDTSSVFFYTFVECLGHR